MLNSSAGQLQTLTSVFPMVFQCEDVFAPLIKFLDVHDESIAELALQIITNIGDNLETNYPNIGAYVSVSWRHA